VGTTTIYTNEHGTHDAGETENTNLGAVEDGEPAVDTVPLNDVKQTAKLPTGILQIRTAKDGRAR
jgi:hypothetical protein